MLHPAVPKSETHRLQELNNYHILDTIPEQDYDDITRIAAQICDVPIALISLVDENRQWFKSKQGLKAPETPRTVSFCGHAINTPQQFFEVNDATQDPRFADNPLVTGDPNVVFYLGSPLVTPNGEAIGTLCVIDHKPRQISEQAKATLRILARQVICNLELRKKNATLGKVNKQLHKEIEERQAKEQELIKLRDQALEAERAKDQFLSNMSHEIRTPLNGIIGITKLLLADQSKAAQDQDLIQSLDFSANHLLRMINDALDLSKMRHNKLDFENLDFDFFQFMRHLHGLLSIDAQQKGIDCQLTLDPLIPKIINGDSHRLGQIILNLVNNAIKFTDQGFVSITVNLESLSPDKVTIGVAIKDTGIGIPPSKIHQIFDQFVQSDSHISRTFGGTGLGLTISKSLIEAMGGTIKVDSILGQGSTFSFKVVLGLSKAVLHQQKAPLTPRGSSYPSLPLPLHILVAEDNIINQKVAKKYLERFGCSCSLVNNGQEALDKLAQENFDLVLMDVNMPVMDGLQAARTIRSTNADYKDIKIVAWTASILNDDTQKCLDAGMDDFIAKPFKPRDLYQKIKGLAT